MPLVPEILGVNKTTPDPFNLPGDQLNLVAVNKLDQQAWGTPAIADGSIFIRTVDNLYCIDAGR
ncbi:hypothetical protein PM8797T_02969 [Gimesia maris DSM 8797]|uniref:Pyrrolo-quinoline quinone n=2 Tax=Gimesia maris TaxID=122 RepID=A0ABX5YJZ5_9PLAN|nr:hypothetical protein PM8797T_02969 [Gimesia maris DSM 8797]QEG15983.1 hypothetical protein GmarT_18440 [Gimesia maris]